MAAIVLMKNALVYRTDVEGWARIEVGHLIDCLKQVEEKFGQNALVMESAIGNLAIQTAYGENADRTPAKGGGMFYVGYIDMVVGDVVWETGKDCLNNPMHRADMINIDGGRKDIEIDENA